MSLQETQLLLWDTAATPAVSVHLTIDIGSRIADNEFDGACMRVDHVLTTLLSEFPKATVTPALNDGGRYVTRLRFTNHLAARVFTQRLGDTLTIRLAGTETSIPVTTRIEQD